MRRCTMDRQQKRWDVGKNMKYTNFRQSTPLLLRVCNFGQITQIRKILKRLLTKTSGFNLKFVAGTKPHHSLLDKVNSST